MRCPHCGDISLDDLTSCRRCAKPLSPSPGYAPLDMIPPPEVASPSFELPPSTLSTPTLPPQPVVVYANIFRRWLAALIDIPLLFFLALLAMILASLSAIAGGTLAGEVTPEVTAFAFGAAFVAAFAVSLAYHVLFWARRGQTPGKMVMGVQVVREVGDEIGYGRAVVRWIGYFCALLPLGLGFAPALFDPHRRGLHDFMAGTYVIRVDSRTPYQLFKELQEALQSARQETANALGRLEEIERGTQEKSPRRHEAEGVTEYD